MLANGSVSFRQTATTYVSSVLSALWHVLAFIVLLALVLMCATQAQAQAQAQAKAQAPQKFTIAAAELSGLFLKGDGKTKGVYYQLIEQVLV
ncbi:hypothetical protein [Colwellia sp. MEBiC06753]